MQPQKELYDHYPEGYFLYKSMTPDIDYGNAMPLQFDSLKRKQTEIYSSIRIFQAMEDFLSTGSYDITGSYVWINNFLMWMQSPILRHNWNQLSFNYSADTREFITHLIKESDALIALRTSKGKLNAKDNDAVSKHFEVKFR